ncbi:class I SAM-dependent methyltransferase [Polyangium spumosum]|uniref:Class I SAM-dependent methyltransferase n=1 Tax=Polyangium spumosum TaxID=889282 RepID=A0A6N7PMX7_9BACT|nr:class I SAM-dependent methyltransferase [Polyangium spumosum]MRG91504.1 class I SAM-dependent methyltransferase [Polyangium spumosum]
MTRRAIDADLKSMIDDVRAGRPVSDRAFDRLFPEPIRRVSSRFWTPLVVARKVSRLLAEEGGPVLDVGAGVGKLCITGALTTGAVFHGIEHRASLVQTATEVIDALGLTGRAEVRQGTLDDVDWEAYRAFYFCNPFEENIFPEARRLDDAIPLTEDRFRDDTARVTAALDAAPVGTRIVTFHGLGARVPATYHKYPERTAGTTFLNLWIKVEAGSAGGEGTFDGWIAGR